MIEVYIVRFWKIDEPDHFASEFSDGAKASDFVILKQSQGFLTSVTTEEHKEKSKLKKFAKKALSSIGSALMGLDNNDN